MLSIVEQNLRRLSIKSYLVKTRQTRQTRKPLFV